MTVVRNGDRLVLVNSVRLDDNGLAALEKLCKVTDVGFSGWLAHWSSIISAGLVGQPSIVPDSAAQPMAMAGLAQRPQTEPSGMRIARRRGMRNQWMRTSFVCGLLGMAASACAIEDGPDGADEYDELDDAGKADGVAFPLGADEIVGALGFAETRTVPHPGGSKFRALKIMATAGDSIDVWVRSTNGDPKAWLANANFTGVAASFDASPTDRNSHIVYTTPQSGTYYLIVRESLHKAAAFTVVLAPRIPLDQPAFTPCEGAGLSDAEVLARIPAGSLQLETLNQRTSTAYTRRCAAATGCSPWTPSVVRLDLSLVDTQTSVALTTRQFSSLRNPELEATAALQAGGVHYTSDAVYRVHVESDAKLTASCVSVRHKVVRSYDGYTVEELYLHKGAALPPAPRFPAEPSSWRCTGPELGAADTLPLFAPGSTQLDLGRQPFGFYNRSCTPRTGCSAWGASGPPVVTQLILKAVSRGGGVAGVDLAEYAASQVNGIGANVDSGHALDQSWSGGRVSATVAIGCAGMFAMRVSGHIGAQEQQQALAGKVLTTLLN